MSRPATSRLKVNPPLGMRPSLEFRRLNELQIDSSYQRSLEASASQTLIRRIAQYWDWSLCQPLAIAKRPDGALMVVDGQHRLEAARLRRDIDDLPCVVTAYPSAGDEAAAFVALNQQRRPLSRIDLYKAALIAGDEAALKIKAVMTAAGVSLAPHLNYISWKPGMVSNIAGIQAVYVSYGARVLSEALEALSGGFPGQVLRYAGTIFPGVAGFIAEQIRFEGVVDKGRLHAALAAGSQKAWIAEIGKEMAASGTRRNLAGKAVVANAYKHGRPGRSPVKAAAPSSSSAKIFAQPDADGMVWCEQCDRRVSPHIAERCTSRFCSVAKAA